MPDSLEFVVGQMLAEKKLTLSLAESCTGGWIAKAVTEQARSKREELQEEYGLTKAQVERDEKRTEQVIKDQVERVRVACATPVPGSCGNGIVDGGEDCDTGIALGQPGACQTVTVAIDEDLDGNGTPETSVTYEVFSGIGLACADRAYRPFLLHPTTGSEATASPETFGTFFRYLCLQSWDEAQGKAVYRLSLIHI